MWLKTRAYSIRPCSLPACFASPLTSWNLGRSDEHYPIGLSGAGVPVRTGESAICVSWRNKTADPAVFRKIHRVFHEPVHKPRSWVARTQDFRSSARACSSARSFATGTPLARTSAIRLRSLWRKSSRVARPALGTVRCLTVAARPCLRSSQPSSASAR